MTTLEILNISWEQKLKGIFFSGVEGEGEYKQWYSNGNLQMHYFYKKGKAQGRCRLWSYDGKLLIDRLYENGESIVNYLK